MNETIKELLKEKEKYESHPEHPGIQEKELYIIAESIVAECENIQVLTPEEQKALEWAEHTIAIY